MIYDSIEPLTPIRDPTVVNNGLSSMKPTISSRGGISIHFENEDSGLQGRPSATSANPEYAFSTVITTANADPWHQGTSQRGTTTTTYAYPLRQQPQ